MAAYSFHRSVELVMKRQKTVFDFRDFENVIDKANGVAEVMSYYDFRQYQSKLSHAKSTCYPLLDNVVVAEFRKGSFHMFWKSDFEAKQFNHGEFLQKKFIKSIKTEFPARQAPRGIPELKKNDIITKLCPMMNEQRRSFWEGLPTTNVSDLIDNFE